MNKKRIPYRWIIVAAVWLVYFFVNNPPCYGTNVISARLVSEHHWGESVAGLSLSFHYLAIGLAAMPVGWVNQRFGPRRTILVGSLLGAACYLALLRVRTEPGYVVLFFLLGISVSACASVSCPSLVNAWFPRKKALPMAVLMTAGGIGGFLFPVLSERMTAADMQSPWRLYLGMALAAGALAVLAIRDKPRQEAERLSDAGEGARLAPAPGRRGGETLRQAAAAPRFYYLGFMIFSARAIFSGYISYSLLCTMEGGIPLAAAARILSAFSVFGMAGRILAAFIDRIPLPLRFQTGVDFALLSLGPLCLVFAGGLPACVAAAFFTGLGFGFENTLFPLLVPHIFGEKHFPMIYGAYNLMGSAGATIAPLLVFLLRRAVNSYSPGFLMLAALGLISTALIPLAFRRTS